MNNNIQKDRIAVVIPSYNEGNGITKLVKEITKQGLRVILVDDGSRIKIPNNIVKTEGVLLLRHKINLGKGAAMKTGCDMAFNCGFEAVIFMDADGQHLPKDISKFINALNSGVQVVFGSRNFGINVPLVRYIGNKFASLVISGLFGIYISDVTCGFRALTKKAYQKIRWDSSGYAVETEMVIRTVRNKLKHREVPVEVLYLDKVKGVTILDAFSILMDVFKWKVSL